MLVVATLAVAAGVGLGYRFAGQIPRTGAETAAPPEPARDRIAAPGRLLPEGGLIPVYGPPADRIAKVYPMEAGTVLRSGDPIAELASRKDRLLEVRLADTQLAEAKVARDGAERAAKKKLAAGEAELGWARAARTRDRDAADARLAFVKLQAEYAARQLTRAKEKGATAAEGELDRAELLAAQTDAELTATRAAREKAELTHLAAEAAAQAKIDGAEAELKDASARAPVRAAEERLELAKLTSEATVIKAPVAGRVLKVFGREGQPTGMEPIVLLAAVSPMTAVVEASEADAAVLAGWLRAGPVPAEVTGPALSRPLKGVVRADADLTRMPPRSPAAAPGAAPFEVVVHLDDAAAPEAARLVGLPVTAALGPGK
jgi:HlyD family secretion protein